MKPAGQRTHAAVRGFAEVVRRLRDAGVGVNRRYRNNLTALMWAASYEDGVGIRAAESVIDLLLKAGAEVNASDDRGRTALMMAAELDHADVVDLLIKSGADRNLRDKAGKTVFDLSASDQVRRVLALDSSASCGPTACPSLEADDVPGARGSAR
jgi:ankyrin repeat protein